MSGTSMAAPHVCGVLLATGGHLGSDGFVIDDPDGNPDLIVSTIQPPTEDSIKIGLLIPKALSFNRLTGLILFLSGQIGQPFPILIFRCIVIVARKLKSCMQLDILHPGC